jgi:hypothetical protein
LDINSHAGKKLQRKHEWPSAGLQARPLFIEPGLVRIKLPAKELSFMGEPDTAPSRGIRQSRGISAWRKA